MTNETTASERERFEPEAADLAEEVQALRDALAVWEGEHCGGDCLAAPCRHCDGTCRIPGKGERLQNELDEAREELAAARVALPAPADHVLVPKRLTRAMREVLDEEGWTWEDLLAAAEAITEAEYADISAAVRQPKPRKRPRQHQSSIAKGERHE